MISRGLNFFSVIGMNAFPNDPVPPVIRIRLFFNIARFSASLFGSNLSANTLQGATLDGKAATAMF